MSLARRSILTGSAAAIVGAAANSSFAFGAAKTALLLPPGAKMPHANDAYALRMQELERAVNDVGIQVELQKQGLEITFSEIKNNIDAMNIPPYMVALTSRAPDQQIEIIKQFHFLGRLAGDRAKSTTANRAEQLLVFAACAQLPTPNGLGPEGCTAAMSRYIFANLKQEASLLKTQWIAEPLTTTQGSAQLKSLLTQAAARGFMTALTVPFNQLQPGHFHPGDLIIAEKPGGTHVMACTRVPAGWNSDQSHWDARDLMMIANTGLSKFGLPHMILAQEYVSFDPKESAPSIKDYDPKWVHNDHGVINSHYVVFDLKTGDPILEDPKTNIYFVKGAAFNIFSFV